MLVQLDGDCLVPPMSFAAPAVYLCYCDQSVRYCSPQEFGGNQVVAAVVEFIIGASDELPDECGASRLSSWNSAAQLVCQLHGLPGKEHSVVGARDGVVEEARVDGVGLSHGRCERAVQVQSWLGG